MRQFSDSPIGQAALVGVIYVASSGALMFANGRFVAEAELPWTWFWGLWAAFFAPVPIATILASVQFAPRWRRLKLLYVLSLLTTLAAMETLWLVNAHMRTVVVVVVSLCVVIMLSFRAFDGTPKEPE